MEKAKSGQCATFLSDIWFSVSYHDHTQHTLATKSKLSVFTVTKKVIAERCKYHLVDCNEGFKIETQLHRDKYS